MKINNRRRFYALLAAALVFIPALTSCQKSEKKYDLPVADLIINTNSGKSFTVKAELAIKEEERNYGFMNRKVIPDGTGMLFIFEDESKRSFWMKNTPHPLSIAYIDAGGEIADIFDMKPYSLTDITSSRSVKYALEVPQGWFDKNGIKVKDKVIIPEY
ncbi:MAG: DUF192 domain-containing protein [Treponema sp.]|nr:DUF192 domain-containing protein [Treponema sp.]